MYSLIQLNSCNDYTYHWKYEFYCIYVLIISEFALCTMNLFLCQVSPIKSLLDIFNQQFEYTYIYCKVFASWFVICVVDDLLLLQYNASIYKAIERFSVTFFSLKSLNVNVMTSRIMTNSVYILLYVTFLTLKMDA